MVKLPAYPSIWMELKWLNHQPVKPNKVAMTELQRAWMKRHLEVGGFCCWVVGWPMIPGRWWRAGAGISGLTGDYPTTVNSKIYIEKKAGEPWRVEALIAAMVSIIKEERKKHE